ncbi:MAG: DUF3080 family protein [Myxococcota bacterium]
MNAFLLPRALAFAAGCAAAWLATGCGAPDVVSRVDAYHAAVHATVAAEVTGLGPRRGAPARERSFPRLRERRLDVGDERIGLLDFLSLQGCRLGELAGHRNSPLGRVMVGTRRLAYEVDVLLAGEACLEGLDREPRLRLGALLERKRRELPRHVWNALWTDSELDPYLSREAPPAPDDWDAYGTWALVELARSLDTLGSVRDARAIEATLGELRRAAPAGGLLRAVDAVGHHLGSVAELLGALDTPGCRGATRRLARIFQTTYLDLQPELARLDRRGAEVIEALAGLYTASAAEVEAPPSMARYHREQLGLEGDEALFARYRRAVARHARAWEAPLRACGLLPTPPSVEAHRSVARPEAA